MNRADYIKQRIKELKSKGYTSKQANAVAQQGVVFNYDKIGDKNIKPTDTDKINDLTVVEFTPEFTDAYFSNQSTPAPEVSQEVIDYTTMPVQDITSDGRWTDRKVWRTQKPGWFVGKKAPVEGRDYTTVPYSKWADYQNSEEYQKYTNPESKTVVSIAGMQQGGKYSYAQQGQFTEDMYGTLPGINYNFNSQAPTTQNSFENTGYTNYAQDLNRQHPLPQSDFRGYQQYNDLDPNFKPSNILETPETPTGIGQSAKGTTTYNDNTRYNVINPYGGVGLEDSLLYAGQGFGEGNVYKASLGTGLSLLKGARNVMSGYASGKESQRVKKEQYDELYNSDINYNYVQQGGKIKNSDVLTGQYIVDQGQGNTNVEGDEYIKTAQDGKVREVLGDPHTKNGKVSNGVDVTLENGDKVLSAYTKIPAKNIKELKDRYNLTLKKGATFADAQKSYDKKLGIVKETDFLAGLIEKLGKNEQVEDATTKRLNELNIVKSIEDSQEKIEQLNAPKAMLFDNLFDIQESLPKKGNGKLLDDKGRVIEGQNESVAQQGGEFETIAKKYGISVERAHELLAMQQGGMQGQEEEQVEGNSSNPQEEQGEVSPEQIMQYVQQALSQGAQPEELLQQLLQEGIDEASATQLIQQVMQQMQGGQEQAPQQQEVAQEGLTYSFPTRLNPTIDGYTVEGKPIVNQDSLTDVEPTQKYTGKGYGVQMKDVEDTIKLHSWYFDSDAKKKAFREAVAKEGLQPEIKDFQNAYNVEIRKRAEKAGVPKDEINDIISKVGFSGSGVQDFDGKFGAFTSTRPLYDFSKVADEVKVTETAPDEVGKNKEEQRDITKNVIPWMPQNLGLAPSSLDPIHKEQIALPRAEAVKLTTEPMLAEQERLRQTDVARIQQSGLTIAQQEALMGQGLAASQMASNDAIGKVEQLNMDSQLKTDQFNMGQRSKEDITNAQYNQVYQGQVLGGLNAQERDWRNYYTEGNLQNNQNFKDIENINMVNSTKDQYAYIPGQGNVFLNNRASDLSLSSLDKTKYEGMTAEEIDAYIKDEVQKSKAAGLKKYKMTVSNS